MRNAGLGSWPERRLRMTPDRDAIWFEGRTTSHAGFAERVRRTAAGLAGLGVRHGDRVAWFSANHPSALETLFACGQLGAIWVPINARLTVPEAQYILEHSGATAVVHGCDQAAQAADLVSAVPAVRSWIAIEPPPDGAGSAQSISYERLLAEADPRPRDEPVGLEDPCLIMYTSGTTGRPKGVVLTHGNMTWNAVLVVSPDTPRDPAGIAAALRERLAGFKIPRHFLFVDGLPKTATGKIRKPDLRAQFVPQEPPSLSGR